MVGLDHGLFLRHLLGVEVVLEEAVVQVDGGQLLDFLGEVVADFFDHKLQEVFLELEVINEDLQQVLNPDLLVRLEGVLVLVLLELLAVLDIVNQTPCDVLDDLHDPLLETLSLSDDFPELLLVDLLAHVILLFQQLRHVLSQALNFLLQVVDLRVDDVQSLEIVVPVFNLDLHQQSVVLGLLSQSFSLVERLLLLTAHFDGRVNVKDRLSVFGVL